MNSLNATYIQAALPYGQVSVFDEIDSTNNYLLNRIGQLTSGSLCLAECQTAGRGRRGRQWYSPVGQNLYFSLLWKYPPPLPASIPSLSLRVALVVAETFVAEGVSDIQIKWPNDIYYQGKKAGGILIESRPAQGGIALVIGIGLNLGMGGVDPTIVNQAWAELSTFQIERNQFAARLAVTLQHMLHDFPIEHDVQFVSRWQKFDAFYQKKVKLLTENDEIHGVAYGITPSGELLLEIEGQRHAFAIGELSLRLDDEATMPV